MIPKFPKPPSPRQLLAEAAIVILLSLMAATIALRIAAGRWPWE